MPTVEVPYDRQRVACTVPDARFLGVLTPKELPHTTREQQREIVHAALQAPIESRPLHELSMGKAHILVITSDHTRPLPSAITMPLLLKEIRRGAPQAEIHILIATGFHRAMTQQEIAERFGEEIAQRETIMVHNGRDMQQMVYKGIMPSGGELWLNKEVDWADLIVSEGFIEPHFFAGYSGGRKSILPGIASEKTVFFNHNAEFIADDKARIGVLDGNPIHRDMEFAAKQAGLAFILNVCLNDQKQIVRAFAGDPFEAHAVGCAFVSDQARTQKVEADIVVTGNGGAPLDLNIYQSVKCMSGAEPCVREGGVIIALCSCYDGHGSEGFYQLFRDNHTPQAVEAAILDRGRDGTMPDQWQAQVLARVMKKAHVILVTQRCDPQLIEQFGIRHANTFEEAMAIADGIVGKDGKVLFMPNGVELIAQ